MNQQTGKIEFTYQFSEFDPKVTMTLAPGTSLPQVLEAFEMFLLASGYSFKGVVDIVEPYDADLVDPNAERN